MLSFARFLLTVGFIWAIAALIVEVLVAWGGGRSEYATAGGSRLKGTRHSFTGAVRLGIKEAFRTRPLPLVMTALFHVGILVALLNAFISIVFPNVGKAVLFVFGFFVVIGLPGGVYLFIRRLLSGKLREISSPENYIAIAASTILLLLTLIYAGRPDATATFFLQFYAALFLIYLPLGSLRHAAFAVVARRNTGRRLGFRGSYPPPKIEDSHVSGK
jgi:nitrate reductase gamma subunit